MENKRQQLLILQLSLFTLLSGRCSSQIQGGLRQRINPCDSRPTSHVPFLSWNDAYLSDDWWNYVNTAANLPLRFANVSQDTRCLSSAIPATELGTFYWQPSCPYTMNWLSKFDWYYYNTRMVETCYVLFPCSQNVSIATCTWDYCSLRCNGNVPVASTYSVCLETNLREYRDIWVFCPITYDAVLSDGTYVLADCLRFPERCLKQVTLMVPQCCECWSCWNHGFSAVAADEAPEKKTGSG